MWNDFAELSRLFAYFRQRSVFISIPHRGLKLIRCDTGNQTNPKSIIEWCDVEDETRKLDSYSLKVRPFAPKIDLD